VPLACQQSTSVASAHCGQVVHGYHVLQIVVSWFLLRGKVDKYTLMQVCPAVGINVAFTTSCHPFDDYYCHEDAKEQSQYGSQQPSSDAFKP
jgi:hypothetical protein